MNAIDFNFVRVLERLTLFFFNLYFYYIVLKALSPVLFYNALHFCLTDHYSDTSTFSKGMLQYHALHGLVSHPCSAWEVSPSLAIHPFIQQIFVEFLP